MNRFALAEGVQDGEKPIDFGDMRKLVHGKTIHGAQMLNPSLQRMPVSYYYQGGGFADVYDTAPKPFRTAVIGLGAGVM
jgi:hypothetical protein